jgi:uncharacterized protein
VEWDPAKALRNAEKHRVSFEEAATVFDDPLFITVVDVEHSLGEDRFITIGLSHEGRLLVVAHAESVGRTRIISTRPATGREERFYAESEQPG